MTGPQANIGKDDADGLKLYLSSVENTIAGRTIEPIFADDRFAAEVALTKAQELVDSQHVAALLGFTSTPAGAAAAAWVKQSQRVPMLITSNAGGERMLTDPKLASPYLTRWTQTDTEIMDVAADWGARQGFHKASMLLSDYAAGIESADLFASTFIRRGGSVVQEQYPPLGTADFGPYIAQLNSGADVLLTLLPGVDALHFGEQLTSYGANHPRVIDALGQIASGPNLAQLGDKARGVTAVDVFSEGDPDPGVQAFVASWRRAYPGRPISHDAAAGYASGQILAAGLSKVDGAIEDVAQFQQALYNVSIDSAKGPVKLASNHDVVQDIKVFRAVGQGSNVGPQMLDTYHDVSDTWTRSAAEIANFPWDSFKGKWVGMTTDKLNQSLKS